MQYWLPGYPKNQIEISELEEIGLGYAFDSERGKPMTMPHKQGPNGLPGLLVTYDASCVGYRPDQQTWKPLVDHEREMQVGITNNKRPKPKDLARTHQLVGEVIDIGGMK